ncbi:50S ribosomal protein L5 [candidate division WWE3 bacterium]|nr:50S ribosomal protein L5 [candidate division WWE3 bacterium]
MQFESRLQKKMKEEIAPALKKELKIKNYMNVPSVQKVIINAGVGPFRENADALSIFETEMTAISGQKPSPRRAKTSEAGFKIRQNDLVGYAVTLRGGKMWAFLDKFVNIVLPRVRDFNGLDPKGIDEGGNYSVGIKEHTLFPEVNQNATKGMRSLQIVVVTNSGSKDMSKTLLTMLGFPFMKVK